MRVLCVLAALLVAGCGCRRSTGRARLDAGMAAPTGGTGGAVSGGGGTGGPPTGPVDAAIDAFQPREEVGTDTAEKDARIGLTPDTPVLDVAAADLRPDLPPPPDGPPPTTPLFHLTLPLSTSVVTTRNPTVGWTDPGGTDYFIIELCRDAACNDMIERNFSGLTTYTVQSTLEGVVYWRVKAMLPRTLGQLLTGTAEMFVGPQTAHDTSMFAYPDFNRDGVPDVALAAEGGDVTVRFFRSDGMGSLRGGMQTVAGPARALAYGVDLNADGFGDLLVARGDAVDVYYGSATTLIGVGSLSGEAGFGATLAGVGDINGDGFGDALIGTRTGGGAGSASLYLSSRMGLAKPTGAPLPSARFGAAADVNADGYADVVSCSPETGKVSLHSGAASGLVLTATLDDPRGTAAGSFGNACQGVGDINGDGFGDVVVTGSNATQLLAFVYLGGEKGLGTPAAIILGSAAGRSADDLQVAAAGDVDRDGRGDVAFAGAGAAHVFLGTATGLAGTAAATVSGDYRLAAGVGDLNGDRYGDVLVAPRSCSEPVKIFAGKAGGLDATPLFTYPGMVGCPAPLVAR